MKDLTRISQGIRPVYENLSGLQFQLRSLEHAAADVAGDLRSKK